MCGSSFPPLLPILLPPDGYMYIKRLLRTIPNVSLRYESFPVIVYFGPRTVRIVYIERGTVLYRKNILRAKDRVLSVPSIDTEGYRYQSIHPFLTLP